MTAADNAVFANPPGYPVIDPFVVSRIRDPVGLQDLGCTEDPGLQLDHWHSRSRYRRCLQGSGRLFPYRRQRKQVRQTQHLKGTPQQPDSLFAVVRIDLCATERRNRSFLSGEARS